MARMSRTGRRKVEMAAMERAMDGGGGGVALEFRRTARDLCLGKSSASVSFLFSFSLFFFGWGFPMFSYAVAFIGSRTLFNGCPKSLENSSVDPILRSLPDLIYVI